MSNLTSEQLAELTERICARLDEFEMPTAMKPTRGVVRIMVDLIDEWQTEQDSDVVEEYANARQAAYNLGYAAAKAEMSPVGNGDANGGIIGVVTGPQAVAEMAVIEAIDRHNGAREYNGPIVPRRQPPDDLDVVRDYSESKPRPTLPDVARENLATALATGTPMGGTLALATGQRKHAGHVGRRQSTYKGKAIVTREEVIVALRDMAMGGAMPSQTTFDDAKPASWPWASSLCQRLGMTWEQLANEAGLKPNRARR